MSSLVTVATCNLNQWALDFDGNLERIVTSIKEAKEKGATYRVGPELEICGYGCEDHFLEQDTFYHCWESMEYILQSDITNGILCDIGMPVMHQGVRYNCRIFCLNQQILFIRPKFFLADDGNYREKRWFTTWKSNSKKMIEQHVLPKRIQKITKQIHVPFGCAAISTLDTLCSSETCEELFTPDSPHINLSLAGVEIIGNGSGSHHQLRKLNQRMDLIKSATTKNGGIYLYANQQGCDGGRLYYDGCAAIAVNGQIVAQGSQFSVNDVEVVTATIDLEDVRSFRAACSSRSEQASSLDMQLPKIIVNFSLCHAEEEDLYLKPSAPIDVHYHAPEEEIALGPACWLWDYLRRSGGNGYFLPLSGGADSSSVACIVGVMCHLVVEAANKGDKRVIEDVQRIIGTTGQEYFPLTPQELANHIFHTTYMGTKNSSNATKNRAEKLAKEIGCYHLTMIMDRMVDGIIQTFQLVTGRTPQYLSRGGTIQEDLALQNIQARLRMVMAYLLAQLLPWVRNKKGFLLVLSSANVDEALRGYMTKYDCSSGDLNPIGAVSKGDLKTLLRWAGKKYNYSTLLEIVEAPPTAELRPTTEEEKEKNEAAGSKNHSQLDEEDMGMSYEELGWFGRLRKIDRCGPYWMYRKLVHTWHHLTPRLVAEKVKRFFFYYSINRHKMTTLTPSYHAENYSPDDNRFDLRPFLYNARWTRQFQAIDQLTTKLEAMPHSQHKKQD
jgi:NAD+ synthase (glutamine-hydrolysing)